MDKHGIKEKKVNQDKLYGGQWFDLGRQMAHRSNKCDGTSRAPYGTRLTPYVGNGSP